MGQGRTYTFGGDSFHRKDPGFVFSLSLILIAADPNENLVFWSRFNYLGQIDFSDFHITCEISFL